MKTLSLALALLCPLGAHAATYVLTVTNGAATPLSPFAVYVQDGALTDQEPGTPATGGFVRHCQTGNPDVRAMELNRNRGVRFVSLTAGLLQPGESRTLEVPVSDPARQSLHFEAMYVKSKDVCGVATVNSHTLVALEQHVTMQASGKDDVLSTGAFAAPASPAAGSAACASSPDAVSCLRELSVPAANGKIGFFAGYLPGVVSYLEGRYGAADTLSILFPASGAIRYELRLKH